MAERISKKEQRESELKKAFESGGRVLPNNFEAEQAVLGCALIDKALRKGAEGLNIAFLHPKSTCGTLVELCEDPNK